MMSYLHIAKADARDSLVFRKQTHTHTNKHFTRSVSNVKQRRLHANDTSAYIIKLIMKHK